MKAIHFVLLASLIILLFIFAVFKVFIPSIVLLIAILIILLYNLWELYKGGKELVSSNHKAVQHALAKHNFLANMSHEIRTPLNSVIGLTEQLGQSKLDEGQLEQLTAIRSSSRVLLDLVNDILDFTKYESDKVKLDKRAFVPLLAINEVVAGIAIQASQKGLTLTTNISFGHALCVSGDSLRLKQVLLNLLSNAIKFTERGSVTVKADVDLTSKIALLKIEIIDTGFGISAADLVTIFEEFEQGTLSSMQLKQKGTGLGLASCKKIVELQDGEIKVISQQGQGSIFSFSIPYQLCNPNELKTDSPIAIDFLGLKGKNILIADDNKMNVLLARTIIAKYQMTVSTAYDGQEAFDLFLKNGYDLVLTDIQMPNMDGVALTKAIRSATDPIKCNIPILGITANVFPEDRSGYLDAGLNALISKPFSESELMTQIAAQLR